MLNPACLFCKPYFCGMISHNNDNLTFADVEMAIVKGRIDRKFTRDPRGTRYEVIGPATDGRIIGIICRIKSTGKLLFITTYALEETK